MRLLIAKQREYSLESTYDVYDNHITFSLREDECLHVLQELLVAGSRSRHRFVLFAQGRGVDPYRTSRPHFGGKRPTTPVGYPSIPVPILLGSAVAGVCGTVDGVGSRFEIT